MERTFNLNERNLNHGQTRQRTLQDQQQCKSTNHSFHSNKLILIAISQHDSQLKLNWIFFVFFSPCACVYHRILADGRHLESVPFVNGPKITLPGKRKEKSSRPFFSVCAFPEERNHDFWCYAIVELFAIGRHIHIYSKRKQTERRKEKKNPLKRKFFLIRTR